MPLIDYICRECGYSVDDVLRPKEDVPTCPECDIMLVEASWASRSIVGYVEGGTGGGAGAGIVQKMPKIDKKGKMNDRGKTI